MPAKRPSRGILVVAAASILLARHAGAASAFPQASPAERALIAAARAAVQARCDCVAARKHGAYLRCATQTAKAEVADGRLSRRQMHEVRKCAARSTCGRAASVTCCKTSRRGRTKCVVIPATKCTPPRGGTACTSAHASWCDAIEQGCAPAVDPPHDTQCCLPTSPGGAILDGCELLKPDECATNGGLLVGDGVCDPNPCPPISTSTTTTTTSTTATSETTTTLVQHCGDGIVQLELDEQCDPPWSRNPIQCPPHAGRQFAPECGDDCRCITTSAPSTTTTSSTATTTTTPSGLTLRITTQLGTSTCGGAGLNPVAAAPISGELDSDAACTQKLSVCGGGVSPCDLGLGCLYFGGGNGNTVPPGRLADASTTFMEVVGGTGLAPSAGSGPKDCSGGAGPMRHCINGSPGTGGGACALDADCSNDCIGCNLAGACALDANCFFGPPLPIPSPLAALTTCVVIAIQSDAGGTIDQTTGSAGLSLPLSSRVYISGNTASPCPKCISGSCDPTWKTTTLGTSPDSGQACTGTGLQGTTIECRPRLANFQAPLAINLIPLTTGTATLRGDESGFFCPEQSNAGAFGRTEARCVKETGAAAGVPLTDNLPHPMQLGSVYCVPATGNAAIDGVADLPGPAAIGLNTTFQLP